MGLSILAVLLVMAVMAAFMLFALYNLQDEVKRRIDVEMGQIFRRYDDAIEQKSRKLTALQLQKEELSTTKPMEFHSQTQYVPVYMEPQQQHANYVDTAFFERYAWVEHSFRELAQTQGKQCIDRLMRMRKDVNVHEFRELLELFDGEVQYEMYLLEEDGQLEVLALLAANSVGKQRVLLRYLEEQEGFDFRAFMDYIRNYIFLHDASVTVSSRVDLREEGMGKHVHWNYDEYIHEGCIVTYQDHLYDYSL